MKRLDVFHSLALLGLCATLSLAGCSGMGSDSYGVIGDPPGGAQVSPPIEGSVFGGHAPLVGARVYVLTPSRTTNYGLASSLMQTTTASGASAVTPDVSGGATNGMYYVTTDGVGGFALTGDYACTAGYPVYLAAVGGAPSDVLSAGNTFAISTIQVNSTTATTEGLTVTTAANNFTVGEQVVFRSVTGTFAGLSGSSATATAVSSTSVTFTAALTTGVATGTSYTATGSAIGISTNNLSVVNMAALGTCPTSGNFSTVGNGAISFIFMNEVSTTAIAYGMAGFGKDAFHIGADLSGPRSAYVANSLNQAIFNAYLLYDIQGGDVNNTTLGEGHIARASTPEGNGTVPQSTLDTLGNILAACVDSGNTYNPALGTGTQSTQCSSLFTTATSDGTTTGTNPTDTAGAIFNIAHFPGGVGNAGFVSTLYKLPPKLVPFSPALTAQPGEFSVTLAFGVPATSGGAGSIINGPQVLSIDAAEPEGIWVGNYYTQPVKIFQSGTPDYTTNTLMAGFFSNQRSVSVDGANNVWMTFADYNTLTEITNLGTIGVVFTGSNQDMLSYPMSASIDANGNFLVSNYGQNYITKVSPLGVNVPNNTGSATSPFSADACIQNTSGTNAIDPNGRIYSLHANATAGAGTMCVLNKTTGVEAYEVTGFSTHVGPNYFSIGPALNSQTGKPWAAWATGSTNNTLLEYIYGSTSTALTLTGGGMSQPCSTAVDSAGTVWLGNGGNSSLSAFAYNSTSQAYYALSPAAGFAAQGGYSNCGNPAIDRAGDVWVAYQGNAAPTLATVYETIGIASPTLTPVGTATTAGLLGTRPR